MAEHISRKELKQDKFKESFQHGAEAVYSHSTVVTIVVVLILVIAVGYAGWKFYSDRQTLQASAGLDDAMKTYGARIGLPNPNADANDISFTTEEARANASLPKFAAIADKYPRTNPGRLARYYQALTLEDLERHNQAEEELKKISSGSDPELAAMAQYQLANIYARTGKPDDAVKTYRALADAKSVFVPRPLVLIELADLLRQSKPAEATTIYQQIKKEYADNPAFADRADRGLDLIAPKS
ncbi:MAG: tetratricopeptide repeat protein [Acidobacteria bacterium]|nr:tetratricopeptide repeat protein [Acidobacteriota bacterium]MBS1867187.1 tetratricopeptide repeat protein [Acidobacteriota bacterium]